MTKDHYKSIASGAVTTVCFNNTLDYTPAESIYDHFLHGLLIMISSLYFYLEYSKENYKLCYT